MAKTIHKESHSQSPKKVKAGLGKDSAAGIEQNSMWRLKGLLVLKRLWT